MGIFNWFRKTKVSLTKAEKKQLRSDQELLAVVASENSSNNSIQSALASIPGFRKVPPLIYACSVGKMFMVKDAINNGSDLNETDEDGITALHAAARDGNIEIVQFLIDLGADKKLPDNKGMLPFDFAKNCGHHAVAELLSGKS